MFGFGKVHGFKRKDWNTEVDRIMRERIGIDTQNTHGKFFPGVLAYAEILDKGWHQKHHPHWYAIITALNFWGGCIIKGGDTGRAVALGFTSQILEFTRDAAERGVVTQQFLDDVIRKIEETSDQFGFSLSTDRE
jgi:hypothetical protein